MSYPHVEACAHLHRCIQQIKEAGAKACITLNPAASTIELILDEVDRVSAMTVNPGFGGQSFIEGALRTVEQVADWVSQRGLSVDIEVDGGVKASTIAQARNAGANAFVAGTAIFKHFFFGGGGADGPGFDL